MTRSGKRSWPASCLVWPLALILVGANQEPGKSPAAPPPELEATLNRITADSLRGHLSFLAADLLEGRQTPSRGLDLAAEYIAAQFRRAGLEPIGDDDYFQTAPGRQLAPDADRFELTLHERGVVTRIGVERISLRGADRAIDIDRAPVVKVAATDLAIGDLKGKAALIEEPDLTGGRTAELGERRSAYLRFRDRLIDAGAALIVTVDRNSKSGLGLGPGRLINPDRSRPSRSRPAGSGLTPFLTIHDRSAAERLDAAASGGTAMTLSLHMAAPVERAVTLRNVAGVLRGSDPKLKETYVLVTAHYDHLGVAPGLPGDQIYNGANDDGSGTASVVELAAALATTAPRPARSLVFMTFYGEEHGMLGSRYYVGHPLVPLESTVACVNLEQVGRTDGSDGEQLAAASMTGFDYSSLGTAFMAAGRSVGVRVFKHPRFSDSYFRGSDNISFAERGIPSGTLCVTYQYPDYHGVGDHWQKIDFANMARVDRMVALGVLAIANDPLAPSWNASNAKAARFAKAASKK